MSSLLLHRVFSDCPSGAALGCGRGLLVALASLVAERRLSGGWAAVVRPRGSVVTALRL